MTPLRALSAVLLAALMVLFTASPPAAHPHPELLETNLMPYPFWTEPLADDIYHVPTGIKLSFGGMVDMMGGDRVVYIGETHNNTHSHRIQLEILRELEKRYPGRIAIGMEMFREPQQESLDRWSAGELGELEFLKASRWYSNWSFNYGYYREIMDFARDHAIDLVALNPPKELQQLVGMGHNIPPEMAARIPDIDSSDPYERAMVQAIYGAHEGGEAMQEAFLRVQLFWEENMAEQIVNYLGSPGGEGKIMVVIAGGGHVQYGFGVPKKVVRRMPLPYSVVLPETISRPEEPEGQQLYMDVDLPEIPLLSADFIWAVPYELLDEGKVLMGLHLNFEGGTGAVEKVMDDSPAMKAGVLDGDVLVTLDGEAVSSMDDVVIVMRSKSVGDSIDIGILRDGEEMTFRARFTEAVDHPG